MNRNTYIYRTCILRALVVVCLFQVLVFPLSAQEMADSAFMFRFYVGKNEFYSPGLNNGPELRKLYECVDLNKDLIKSGEMKVYVDGYSNSRSTDASNRALSKIRSNRVKSELITIKGLKEQNFVTHNHVGEGNYVIVRLNVPKDRIPPAPKVEVKEPPVPEPVQEEIPETPAPPVEVDPAPVVELEVIDVPECPADTVDVAQPEPVAVPLLPPRERVETPFALKTNLLGYPVLMPNLEVEWKCAPRWSVALEGQVAWYCNGNNPHKCYRIATVIPEARYWIRERSRWHGLYVGVFGGVGMYDLCNSREGHEGEGFMAGASVGYEWPISKRLSLDAGVGLGYMRLRDKEYLPFDSHYLYQITKNINYFGPLRLKLSLVWRIPR